MIGVCRFGDRYGDDWPLLPWVGYPIFAFGLGRLALAWRERLRKWTVREACVWMIILTASLPFLGLYYYAPLGHRYACFIFRQSPLIFWSHQLWIFFFIRVCMLREVRQWLHANRATQWISARPINRHFFIVYFAAYPYCLAWGAVLRHFDLAMTSSSVTWGFASCIILIEAISIVVHRVF